jgi:serpin B
VKPSGILLASSKIIEIKKVMRLKGILLALTIGVVVHGNGQTTIQNIVNGNTSFAFDYLRSMEDKNVFISPFSISTAMAMTYAGAKNSTAEEFNKVMHFNHGDLGFHSAYGEYQQELSNNMSQVEWNLANKLWGFGSPNFEKQFLSINSDLYNAPIVFGANEARINKWVEQQTKGKIRDLLPPGTISPDTRLILTNAVYFKANWKYEFEKKDTKKQKFHLANGKKSTVDLMYQEGAFNYYQTSDYQCIRLPYKGDKQSMVVVLPKEQIEIGKIQEDLEKDFLTNLRMYGKSNVQVYLPKFKLEYKELLGEYLIAKGMPQSFSETADFSGMLKSESLWIDAVIHQAFVEVNEEGTEAAAATAVVMTTESLSPSKPKRIIFRADRPFLFFIVDDATQSVLFMGKMMNPTE